MNKISVKITAFALCIVLCLSAVITVFAFEGDKNEEPPKKHTVVSAENKDEEIPINPIAICKPNAIRFCSYCFLIWIY